MSDLVPGYPKSSQDRVTQAQITPGTSHVGLCESQMAPVVAAEMVGRWVRTNTPSFKNRWSKRRSRSLLLLPSPPPQPPNPQEN